MFEIKHLYSRNKNFRAQLIKHEDGWVVEIWIKRSDENYHPLVRDLKPKPLEEAENSAKEWFQSLSRSSKLKSPVSKKYQRQGDSAV